MNGAPASFAELGDRLERLADLGGGPARFWLRDDDAIRPTPALDRLLALAAETGMPVALAVIPARVEEALGERLAARTDVTLLQHGWSHADHAPAGEKKAELGDHRAAAAVLAELGRGAERMAGLPHVLPVLVPPWNRIGEKVAAGLPALGFRGLSLFADRPLAGEPLPRLDTHLDPVAWRAGGGFLGAVPVLALLCRRLDRMLSGGVDRGAATGILSHHLVQDEETFTFLRCLLVYLAKRNDCRFISANELLPCSEGRIAKMGE